MTAIDIKDSDFEEKVLKAKLPVFVDFWAPWCGPCKLAGPIIETLSEEHKGKIEFVKVNVDENQIAGKYSVMSIPTTILFKQGKEVGRQIGFAGKNAYEDLIKKGVS